jgi:tripartite-type tricarboxylate transporter receptor subunit TctC
LSSRLGQQFVIENRAGLAARSGPPRCVAAEADGYTLLFAPALVLSVLSAGPRRRHRLQARRAPTDLPDLQQRHGDRGPPRLANQGRAAIWCGDGEARPGALNYGHQGPLPIPHLAMEEFLQVAGIAIADIPFRGEPLVLTTSSAGDQRASIVLGSAAGQNIRLLGVFAATRHPAFPNVPTVKEQGYDVSPLSFGGCWRRRRHPRTSSTSSQAPARGPPR